MDYRGLVVDLDDTLVDTQILKPLRQARLWNDAVRRIPETEAFTGVVEAFSILTEADIPWAVVTTSVSYYAEAVLKHHGLRRTHLVAYHDALPKPNPEGVTLAISRTGLEPDEVIGIGDSEIDRRAYHAAGIPAFGAAWSPALETGDWDAVLTDPAQLCDLLLDVQG